MIWVYLYLVVGFLLAWRVTNQRGEYSASQWRWSIAAAVMAWPLCALYIILVLARERRRD